ncbi:hypothetical protein SAMN05444481_11129 [Flavobacterium frigidimaris]|jgi:hypothetical protein|nr:hypothetical protein SAMN05444481_11129 [Flavobacterium frigidimaris]
MKLLFDANISWRLIKVVGDNFSDSLHTKDIR